MNRSPAPLLAVWGVVFFVSLAFVSLAATPGCGSSGGATGDPNASVASCHTYCDAYLAAACAPSNYASADDCKMVECFHLPESPAICQTKIKTYYDCAQAQADICGGTGCTDQFMAVLMCQ